MSDPPVPVERTERQSKVDAAWRKFWYEGDSSDLYALGIFPNRGKD